MRYNWPQTSILRIFQEAKIRNEIEIELPSPSHAESFRFALYHFRSRSKQGKDFQDFQINLDGNKLIISKPKEIEIKILEKARA